MKYGNVIIGLVLGALMWAIYPSITGYQGPDAGPMSLYLLVLFISGVVSALTEPSNWWKGVIGIYMGQWLYIFLVPHVSKYWLLGMVMTSICLLASVAGGAIVFGIWKIFICKTDKK